MKIEKIIPQTEIDKNYQAAEITKQIESLKNQLYALGFNPKKIYGFK